MKSPVSKTKTTRPRTTSKPANSRLPTKNTPPRSTRQAPPPPVSKPAAPSTPTVTSTEVITGPDLLSVLPEPLQVAATQATLAPGHPGCLVIPLLRSLVYPLVNGFRPQNLEDLCRAAHGSDAAPDLAQLRRRCEERCHQAIQRWRLLLTAQAEYQGLAVTAEFGGENEATTNSELELARAGSLVLIIKT